MGVLDCIYKVIIKLVDVLIEVESTLPSVDFFLEMRQRILNSMTCKNV